MTKVDTAFVLGAGFSKAVSNAMPLTDELGNLVRERVPAAGRLPENGFNDGYFETWLSRLSEPQPDLEEYANLENQALFLRISEQIHTIMQQIMIDVLSTEVPWWLKRLIGLMHEKLATVITFNYDTLIEYAARSSFLFDWQTRQLAPTSNVVRRTPPPPPSPGLFGEPDAKTFRLLKLHGSLDTYGVPNDATGATINRWELQGTWGSPVPVDESLRREWLPGRSPFIVPPAAAKSSFYGNPISKELWRTAAGALNSAARIVLIGYSMPPTDLVTTGMLADAFGGRSVRVDLVNRSPERIVERLRALGAIETNIRRFGGDDAASKYVEAYEREFGQMAVDRIREADDDSLLMVARSEAAAARVTSIEHDGAGVWLAVGDFVPAYQACQKSGTADKRYVETRRLKDLVSACNAPIGIRYTGGRQALIVSVANFVADTGLGNGRWTVLIPSAMP